MKIYFEGKAITKEKAVALFKKAGKIDIISGNDTEGNYEIELSKPKK